MRVAVVNWSSRRVGGIEEYVFIILPALKAAGFQVAFWYERDSPADRQAIIPPPGVPSFCAADIGVDAALQALREWKPDVLYVQGTEHVDVERRLLDIAPAVFFLHTYTGTCISGLKTWTRPVVTPCSRVFGPPCLLHYFPHGCGGNNPVTMWKLYKEQAARLEQLRRYRVVLTHTEHMRHEVGKHGVEAQIVPYPCEAQTHEHPRVPDGSWRLLCAGRMEPTKGGEMLIDAIPKVSAAMVGPLRVTMAGDGRERPRWEARAKEVERSMPNVRFDFPGWLSQDAVGVLMKSSDLLVVPSLWPEPFGSVGPAAGQHGLPAAAFAVGGIPQWLVEGVTGHLAPGDPPTSAGLARAILQCLQDPDHFAALKEGARQMATTFTMERHMPELVKVLARL